MLAVQENHSLTLEDGEINMAFFKGKLTQERDSLRRRIDNYKNEICIKRTSTSVDDIATEYESQAKIKGLRALDESRLIAVGKALGRIDDNSYGECACCYDEIDVRRLDSNPSAENCIDCQTKKDLRERHYA